MEFHPNEWWQYRLFTFNRSAEDGTQSLTFWAMHQCPNAMETVINLIKAFKLSEAILNHKGQHEAYITPPLIISVLASNQKHDGGLQGARRVSDPGDCRS